MTAEPRSTLHVVFGAGGPVGDAIIRTLRARGNRVRAVSRSRVAVPEHVEFVAADATNRDAAFAACDGAGVVFHAIGAPYHRWRELLPPILEGVLDAASHARAKLVYADNLYAYGPVDGVLTEDLPLVAKGPKGGVRAELAHRLLDVHREGRVRTTIGRASDFFGPGVRLSAVGERVFAHALAGRPADLRGNIDTLHTYTYIDDFARGLVTLGDEDAADGQAWHIPSCEPLTTRRFVEQVFEQLGRPARMRVTPALLLRVLGLFDPLLRELPETAYQFERPFLMDTSKYQATFGTDPTPIRTAIDRTIDWYRASTSL